MASKYVPPSEDERFEHGEMEDTNRGEEEEGLPMDEEGNVDWLKFYQKKTPQSI